jgi:hypothetical protein
MARGKNKKKSGRKYKLRKFYPIGGAWKYPFKDYLVLCKCPANTQSNSILNYYISSQHDILCQLPLEKTEIKTDYIKISPVSKV